MLLRTEPYCGHFLTDVMTSTSSQGVVTVTVHVVLILMNIRNCLHSEDSEDEDDFNSASDSSMSTDDEKPASPAAPPPPPSNSPPPPPPPPVST